MSDSLFFVLVSMPTQARNSSFLLSGRFFRVAAALGLALLAQTAHADGGMWPFHNVPVEQIKQKHGVTLTPEWLENVRLASARFGSSSAFVSADGLLLTNHHVAKGCIQRLSTAENDLAAKGFLSATRAEERRCPGSEVTQLVSYIDVTARVTANNAAGATDARARQTAITEVEKQCREETKLRCQVVTMYRGAQYWLYRYKVWSDVRLVWAPETRLGFFGGDPDNFVYPRYALDVALVRAYEDGKPVVTPHYLRLAKDGIKDGDTVFSIGNPGSTDRSLTAAELNFLRMQWYPIRVTNAEGARSDLLEWGKLSAENQRRALDPLFGIENTLKSIRGENRALNVERLHQNKRADEAFWKAKAAELTEKGALRFKSGSDPWVAIAAATEKQNRYAFEMTGTEYAWGTLLRVANDIVALAHEAQKPAGEGLRAYREAVRPQLRNTISSNRIWYRDMETIRLQSKMEEAMSYLGQDHPFVARMLQGGTPQEAAQRVMAGTKLDQQGERRALLEGGLSAINASNDPLLVLVRDLYPIWTAIRERDQREVEAVKEAAHDDIARLRFAVNGLNEAPDATGTLRLAVGKVAGFDRDGILNPWTTTFYGLYDRNIAFGNKPPFDLPANWLAARDELNLATPFNFISTLDIIGGSSGSPAVNAKGELVGVMFDGNLEGLGNRFAYQERTARALAVDVRAIVEALDKVYGAKDLLKELTPHWK
ncbi:MAG: S46 family peptidase [Burkholderiales bacterium]|jgi:hypothetical protein